MRADVGDGRAAHVAHELDDKAPRVPPVETNDGVLDGVGELAGVQAEVPEHPSVVVLHRADTKLGHFTNGAQHCSSLIDCRDLVFGLFEPLERLEVNPRSSVDALPADERAPPHVPPPRGVGDENESAAAAERAIWGELVVYGTYVVVLWAHRTGEGVEIDRKGSRRRTGLLVPLIHVARRRAVCEAALFVWLSRLVCAARRRRPGGKVCSRPHVAPHLRVIVDPRNRPNFVVTAINHVTEVGGDLPRPGLVRPQVDPHAMLAWGGRLEDAALEHVGE